MDYPKIRDLDGVYFRVQRNGKWIPVCFSDLTPDEQMQMLEGRDTGWIKQLCLILAASIRRIGDELDITAEMEGEE